MSEATNPETNAAATPATATPKPARPKFVPLTISDERLAELEAEHEDVLVMKGPEMAPWLAVVRRPTRQETIGFKTHAKRDSTTANEQLVRAICVFPKGEDLARQIARWPLFVDGLCDSKTFRDFVGITVDNDLK